MPSEFVNLYVAQLPDGEDAYDTAHRDPELLKAIIAAAKPWYQHVFDTEELALEDRATGIAGPSLEDRAATVRRLAVVVKAMADPVIRAHYRRRLALIGQCEEADIFPLIADPTDWRGRYRGEL